MTRFRPIRAILASEFWAGSSARSLVPGLRANGWLVAEIDDRNFLPTPMSLSSRISARLRGKGAIRRFQEEILRQCMQLDADVFLTVKGTLISSVLLQNLRRRGITTVNYYPDYHFNDIAIGRMADYDLVATTKSFQVEPLAALIGRERVAMIHHGFSDELHRVIPFAELEAKVDLLYVGNANPTKAALMRTVAERLPDINLRVVGNRWESYARGHRLQHSICEEAPTGDYYAAELSRAKIALAFHMGPDERTGLADLVSTRSFEIPACGAFMLHVDNDEVRSLYDVPSEIDTFTNIEDLVAKVHYWLAHPEERAAVAARGHARAVPAYSYTERGRELAALIERKLGRRST